jgi:hypothetical protein
MLGVAALPVAAKTFCCLDESGKRVCGDAPPPQCVKRGYQEYNAHGVLARQHAPPLTAEERAQRAAEAARKKEAERQAAEQDRRNRALLASYSSVQDIDAKRERATTDTQAAIHTAEERVAAALAKKAKLDGEAEFYLKRPMPETLKAQIRENDHELQAAQAIIEEKKQDLVALAARFAEERRRYLQLTTGKDGTPPPAPASQRPR